MDGETLYYDGAQTIAKLLKNSFGSIFNAFFIGDPDLIPEAALPCVVVRKVKTTYRSGATMTDDVTENIQIHILTSDKIGANTPDDDDTAMRTLQNLVEGRNPNTGAVLGNTVVYALRQNITFNSTIIDNDIDVNYDVTARPNQPSIIEAIIQVTALSRTFFPNRT